MCLLLCGFLRVLVCCGWFHATHELYSDFVVHCCMQGVLAVFVSMWVVDRCASPQMLEVSFQPAFPTSMDRIMLLCVFHFRVRASCFHVTECVHV